MTLVIFDLVRYLLPDIVVSFTFFAYYLPLTAEGYCIVTQCNDPCCLIKAKQFIPMISLSGNAFCNCSLAISSFGEL